MKPEKLLSEITELEKTILKNRRQKAQLKYQIMTLFSYIKKYVKYQIPMKPIDISEDGHHFTCPRCGEKFESVNTYDEFNLCYICGQRWKE